MTVQVHSIVQKVKELAVLPQVVHQILHLTSNPNTTVRDLERLIAIDQGMSTRVLNTVNSAYYGFSRKIASVRDAVMLLGFKTVRNLAITVSVFDMFVGKTDRQNLRRGKWWRHAIDTALCARLIASQVDGVSPDEAYTAGLLHDIGKPLLDRYGDAPYEQVEDLMAQGVPELLAERQVFGCDHAEVGRIVSQHWGFPEKLVEAIGEHHAETPGDWHDAKLVAVTLVANCIAHALRQPDSSDDWWFYLPNWLSDLLQLTPQQLQSLYVGCEAEIHSSPMAALGR
ncbi:MAG: HDOD domain-containing protein [Fimbriimonadales bacterium]|nr:HDOD domain-containing protein [Fimbriimonadales bacterium]MDW8051100.1 HDOD domain-containing protein [Armatimonadota bacterium]